MKPNHGDESLNLSPRIRDRLLQLAKTVPGNWLELKIAFRSVVDVNEVEFVMDMADGTTTGFYGNARVLIGLLSELRRESYRRGVGTWFSVELVIARSGKITGQCNYGEEPSWDLSIPAECYARDLEIFPRDEEFIPAWLRRKL